MYTNNITTANNTTITIAEVENLGVTATKIGRGGKTLHVAAFEIRYLNGGESQKWDGNGYVAAKASFAWCNWHQREACLAVIWNNGEIDVLA